MLEIPKEVTEMQNAFNGLTSGLGHKICVLEYTSIEIFKTKMKEKNE